jgi:polyisoprenoid-binding protein YceI
MSALRILFAARCRAEQFGFPLRFARTCECFPRRQYWRLTTRKDFAMKRLAFVIGILALAAPLALAQTSTWTSDPQHSEVDFNIRHLSVSNIHGRIGGVAATIHLNEANIAKSSVTATIDASNVDTGVAPRDTHLKTADFFDVAKFPTATFTSTSVTKNGNRLAVTGNFTLHGVTRPVVLDVEAVNAPLESVMDHKLHRGFTATTIINRTAYGIGPKFPAAIVGEDVKLIIELEAVKQ